MKYSLIALTLFIPAKANANYICTQWNIATMTCTILLDDRNMGFVIARGATTFSQSVESEDWTHAYLCVPKVGSDICKVYHLVPQ